VNTQALQAEHRKFLNTYYGISRHFYDWTRKYYLLGRDRELRALLREEWTTLVEIGPGTGRNLQKLHHRRPHASYFGIEASDSMLDHARAKCSVARFVHGFAENADISSLVGRPPDRILFSYCLSMVVDPARAIENAIGALAPGGEVVVVDFGDFEGLPRWLKGTLGRWLSTFHVHPLAPPAYESWGGQVRTELGGYVLRARFHRPLPGAREEQHAE